jgi:hypothetical protein
MSPKLQQHVEGTPHQQETTNEDADGDSDNDNVDDNYIVFAKLEGVLAPFFELAVDWPNPRLDIMAYEFRRLDVWLFGLDNKGASFLPSDIVPYPRKERFTSFLPVSGRESKEKLEIYHEAIYEELKRALVPFFQDVLQNTDNAPFRMLADEFDVLSTWLLRMDNARRGDGQITGPPFHIIPFPSGQSPYHTNLPQLGNLNILNRLEGYELVEYYKAYYPSSGDPPSLEDARSDVMIALGVGMKRPPPFDRLPFAHDSDDFDRMIEKYAPKFSPPPSPSPFPP